MGEVYLADDPEGEHQVALKLIRADRAEHVRALRRFTREVRAMARLDHPNIAAVFDYGVHVDDDGVRRPFFVMESVDGQSLREYFKAGPTIEEALPVFDQVLAALGYAHARGVIHRDLKPENVLISTVDGAAHAKILDFGIARMVDDDNLDDATVAGIELSMSDNVARGFTDEMSTLEMRLLENTSGVVELPQVSESASTAELNELDPDDFQEIENEVQSTLDDVPPAAAARLTQFNQCVGTPAYLAPEQIRAKRHGVGPASDLYAVGIMLFELVCGKRPFRARTPKELLKKHLIEPVPQLVPRDEIELPDGLAHLIRRLLSKRPYRRPAFAADVRRELRSIVTGREMVRPYMPQYDSDSSSASIPALSKTSVAPVVDRTPTPAVAGRVTLGLVQFRESAFVGRKAERHSLWQSFSDTHELNEMRVVLVDGEAGIGKTRLVRWLRERAEEQGLARAFVAPFTASTNGLRVAIERHLVAKGLDGEALRIRVSEELKRLTLNDEWLLNSIVSFLRPGKRGGTLVEAAPTLATTYAIGDTLLRRFASVRPVILHMDDVHESPDQSFELLEFLLSQQISERYPALVVATLRSESLLTDPGLRARVRRLAQHPAVSRMTLGTMSRIDIATLSQSLLPLDRATSSIVADRAGGHPEFAIQLLRHWAERETLIRDQDRGLSLVDGGDSIPTRINEVVERRVSTFLQSFAHEEHTSALAHAVLAWMAIIGEPVSFGLLSRLAAGEGITPEQVDLVWEGSLLDGLCVENPLDETIGFGHGVIRAQLLDRARERPGYVRRQVLCAEAKLRASGTNPPTLHYEVAEHLFEAGEMTRAWRHLVFSARCLLDLSHFRLALQRLERALDLVQGPRATSRAQLRVARPTSTPITVSVEERFEARRAYVEAAIRMNLEDDLDQELQNLMLEAGESPARLGWAALLEADVASRRGQVELAASLYREALERFEDAGHDYSAARALRGLGDNLSRAGRIPAGLEALAKAEPVARRSGDTNLLAEVLLSAGASHFDNGSRDASRAYLVEALELFSASSNLAGLGETHLQLGRAQLLLAQLAEARAHFQEARHAYSLVGDRHGVIRVLNGLGEVSRAGGDYEDAETCYLQALEMVEDSGGDEHEAAAVVVANLGIVQLERGSYREARSTLMRSLDLFHRLGTRPTAAVACGLLAATDAALGDFDSCVGWIRTIDSMALDRPPADRDYANHLVGAAHAALRAGARDTAAILLSRARSAYDLLGDTEQVARIEDIARGLGSVANEP